MDEIIAKEVSGRLRVLGAFSRRLEVQVLGNTVFLRGEVDSAWKAKAAERECMAIPGVADVVNSLTYLREPTKGASELSGGVDSAPLRGRSRTPRAEGRQPPAPARPLHHAAA